MGIYFFCIVLQPLNDFLKIGDASYLVESLIGDLEFSLAFLATRLLLAIESGFRDYGWLNMGELSLSLAGVRDWGVAEPTWLMLEVFTMFEMAFSFGWIFLRCTRYWLNFSCFCSLGKYFGICFSSLIVCIFFGVGDLLLLLSSSLLTSKGWFTWRENSSIWWVFSFKK